MKKILKEIYNRLNFHFSKKPDFQPVFLIGCGRSGTTILGKTLGKHKSVSYLNERRDLWHKAYPNFDIWSGKITSPKLIVDKNDNDSLKTKKLINLFYREQVKKNGQVLLEKLPINNFRLDFLNHAFPNSKFIYLHRNGIEVAKSIEKLANEGRWFGKNNSKLKTLNQLSTHFKKPIEECSNFEKGLIEWRFSLNHSESFFSDIDQDRYYSLSYQSFLENPQNQIKNIFTFLNLDFSKEDINDISKGIKRKTPKITRIDEELIKIGGENLILSLENKLRQTLPNND